MVEAGLAQGTEGLTVAESRGLTSRGRTGKFEKTLASAERDREACRLRTRGVTYQQISDQLGYGGEAHARRAVKLCLAAIQTEGAEELRALQLDQLDYLTAQALGVLERRHLTITPTGKIVHADGEPVLDDGPVLQAIDRLLRIQERRAKLMGLDAPQRREVLTLDAIDAEIAALAAELDRDQDGAATDPA